MFQSITLTPTFAVKQSGKRNGPKLFYAAQQIAPDTDTGVHGGHCTVRPWDGKASGAGAPRGPGLGCGSLSGGHFYEVTDALV